MVLKRDISWAKIVEEYKYYTQTTTKMYRVKKIMGLGEIALLERGVLKCAFAKC